jgi:hypothetical protein
MDRLWGRFYFCTLETPFFVFLLLAKALTNLVLKLYENISIKSDNLFLFIFLFTLAQPWTRLLFSLPALQEKFVILAGALCISLVLSNFYCKRSIIFRWLLISIFLLIGCFSREQFILFFPAILASAIVSAKKESGGFRFAALGILPVMLGLVFLIWYLGQGSSYKEHFGLQGFLQTINKSKSIWLFLSILLSSFCVVILQSSNSSWALKLARLFPSISVLGFLAMMAPWGLGGYLNVGVTPFITLCALSLLIPFIKKQPSKKVALGLKVALAGIFLSFLYFDISTKWDLGKLLNSTVLRELAFQNNII